MDLRLTSGAAIRQLPSRLRRALAAGWGVAARGGGAQGRPALSGPRRLAGPAETIEQEVFLRTADLFEREVELICYHTTPARFAVDEADEDGEPGRRRGLALRPVYDGAPRRIVAQVKLCVRALQIQRAAELRTGRPWTTSRPSGRSAPAPRSGHRSARPNRPGARRDPENVGSSQRSRLAIASSLTSGTRGSVKSPSFYSSATATRSRRSWRTREPCVGCRPKTVIKALQRVLSFSTSLCPWPNP